MNVEFTLMRKTCIDDDLTGKRKELLNGASLAKYLGHNLFTNEFLW